MELLLEPFTCEACGFLRRALLAGSLVAVASAVIGTWVVLRGLSFLGDAIAHGALPGIALAFLLGFDLFVGGALSALVMIGLVAYASRRSRLGDDASIGLLFVGMLALGIVLISARGAYAGDLTAVLFGDVVGVTTADVVAAAIGAALTIGVTVALYRPFLVVSFSSDQARLLGMRPRLAHLLQLALLALVIVASFRTVGTLLVFALVVAPPATAAQVARRVPTMMVVAAVLGVVAVAAGLLLSYHLDTAGSATIALVAVAEFFVLTVGRDVRSALARRATGAPA